MNIANRFKVGLAVIALVAVTALANTPHIEAAHLQSAIGAHTTHQHNGWQAGAHALGTKRVWTLHEQHSGSG